VEEYKLRDPIENVKQMILKNEFATEEELDAIDKQIKATVAESVKFAEESEFPDAKEAYTDVYAQEDYPFIIE